MCTKLTLCSPLRSMSKSVLLCISTLLDGGNHCEFARLAVGPRLWGYANSRPALPFFRFQDVQSLRLAGPAALCQHTDQLGLCCVPEDRRARTVRPDSNPRPTIPLCTILEILDSRAPTKIFKTIVVSVAVYVINFTLFGIGAVPMKCYLDNAMEQQTLGATNKHVRLTVAYDRCAFCPPARAFGICTLNSSHVRNAKGGVAKGRKPNFAGEIFLVLVVEGNVVSTCKNSTLCCLRNIGN